MEMKGKRVLVTGATAGIGKETARVMNLLFTNELARRVNHKGITVNAAHPGVVASSFMAKPGLWGIGGKLAGFFSLSPEKGARTSVYLASSPEVHEVTGGYFAKSKPKTPSKAAQDAAAAERLWALSEQLVAQRGFDDRG